MTEFISTLEAIGPYAPYPLLFFTGILLALLLVGADAASVPGPMCGPQRFAGQCEPKRWIGHLTSFFVGLFGYSLLVVLFDRYLSATVLGLVLIVLLWSGNKLKVAVLDEPLVFSDVFLAGHALRYPRLYFGYAPLWIWPFIAVAASVLIAIVWQETSLELPAVGRVAMPFALMGIVWATNEWSRVPNHAFDGFMALFPLSFTANEDARRYTPIGASFLHLLWHSRRRIELRGKFLLKEHEWQEKSLQQNLHFREVESEEETKHLLLIQAESFCRIGTKLDRPTSTPFMDAQIEAGKGGELALDWRGAYTMRSEFAALTGLSPEEVETYGFDPYRLAEMERMNSLAWALKVKGYRTVVWHPNDARFFDRDKVMPNLGFDEFWDLQRLKETYGERLGKFGRYVSDASVLTLAADFLKSCKEPTFLFLITMEAHGPWDGANFPGADKVSETERYEAHMRSLDRGIKQVAEEIESGALNARAFVYGDHIPGITALDRGNEGNRGDWANTSWALIEKANTTALPNKLRPEEIGSLVLSRCTN